MECAWCKRQTSGIYEWTKNKEPLCFDCSNKYHFGLGQKLITGKISKLSTEQKRTISMSWKDTKYFKNTMRYIKNTELRGSIKLLSKIIVLILLVVFLFIFSQISNYLLQVNGIIVKTLILLIGFFIFPVLGMIFLMFYIKIEWLLKIYQLKKENGYSFFDDLF